jgi:hypothetical protein
MSAATYLLDWIGLDWIGLDWIDKEEKELEYGILLGRWWVGLSITGIQHHTTFTSLTR